MMTAAQSATTATAGPPGGVVWQADATCWSVSDSALVRQCLQADGRWLSSNFVTMQDDMFAAAGLGHPRDLTELSQNVLTQQDGSYHDHLRAAVSPVFNRVVKASRPAFEALIASHVAGLGDRFDLVTDLADPVAKGALAIMLDLSAPRQDDVIADGLDVLELLDYDPGLSAARMLDRVQRARLALAAISDVFEQQILDHRPDAPRHGLVAALIDQQQVPGSPLLSHLEIVWQAITTLMAGFVTTTGLISGALAQLPMPPRALVADKAAFRSVFEDLIRRAGPTRFVMRRVTADVTFGGAQIKAGSLLRLCLMDANAGLTAHDPADAAAHLTFGDGMHNCPGTSMAKLLLKATLESLAAHDITPHPMTTRPVTLDRFQAVAGLLSWPAASSHSPRPTKG